ncbi:outer membrane protein TolC [Nonlabens xylanidelens]|uniref:Outer membrane protein TolC n=1 Tax=Nonlabens xylanidelens TaxID=191564 RepID=A0A2S6IN24_9FLAO|nr:TolC family protein [Nonlabens xylanidelens]PPK95540.1 outer membrane protein TolC [Nonlabens xylanidelens]PQJ22350.1 transporter [Nonlabens xylanidelens]
MRYNSIVFYVFLVSAFAKAQQLQTFIKEAQANNLEIKAVEMRHNISQEKVNEADWIPNTEVSLGYFVSETETRVGAQRARIGVKQMLPWFGTITARENYATSLADADYVEITIAKRKLALSVSQTYYQLYSIRAKQAALGKNIQLLNAYEQLALTSVTVGKASAVDVLRLQIRINELQQQIDILEEDFKASQSLFNNLLNKEDTETIEITEVMSMPLVDLELVDSSLDVNPEILKYDKLYESVVQSEVLNKRERLPSIGVGFDYLPVSERADLNIVDNGKDVFMPMVTVSIPIFNKRYKSISKQNELRQQEIEFEKQERLNVLNTAFARARSQRNQARIAYETLDKNLKQARDAEEILIKNYETGTIDFKDVLDIQELQLKFQMEQVNAIENYYVQSAVINYLMN